ncbi:MAG: ribosomal L7Ae/L30e/S12e/Gadd45 family protein [Nanoarchaeota archaeon]
MEPTTLLTTKVQEGKAVLGTERVLKLLKSRKLSSIILARNCPAKSKADIEYYAKLAQIPITQVEQTNEEIGILCKKNFFVSVAGILA